jgi:hypothetical protein
MRSKFALVIIKDIKDYFPPSKWRGEITKDGKFIAKNNDDISVKINPSHVMYNVKIEAEDDPYGDFTNEVTDKPLDVITNFLGEGIPENEVFKQRASTDPDAYAAILRHVASDIECSGKYSPEVMRRIIILPNFNLLDSIINRYAANPADFRMEERILNNFKNEAKKKGWEFEVTDDEPPILNMTIHSFGVKVSVDSIMWDYEFELDGYPKSMEKGQAEDPIHEFENWRFRSNKFKEAAEQYNQDVEDGDEIDTEPPKK